MKELNSKSINKLVSYIRENLSVSAGTGDNKRILIKPGLKITHVGNKENQGSGLNYTVDAVLDSEDGLLIRCVRPPDVFITLTGTDLKQFERT